jgi:hypothetical protein
MAAIYSIIVIALFSLIEERCPANAAYRPALVSSIFLSNNGDILAVAGTV